MEIQRYLTEIIVIGNEFCLFRINTFYIILHHIVKYIDSINQFDVNNSLGRHLHKVQRATKDD